MANLTNNSVFVVYKTDNQLSYASRDRIDIATSLTLAEDIVNQQTAKEGEKLDSDQQYLLRNILQTQGYSGNGEFQIEEIKTNLLL